MGRAFCCVCFGISPSPGPLHHISWSNDGRSICKNKTIVFQTLTINLEELHRQDQTINYTGTSSRFSIYTRRLFKNYIFEIK